MNNICVLVR